MIAAALLLLPTCQRTTEIIGSLPAWNCGPRCFRDENLDGLPMPLEALFTATPDPEPANRPELRYPLPGSLHPINLPDLTFQWRSAGGTHRYYRIRLAPLRDPRRFHDFYVPCRAPPTDPIPPAPDQCQYAMPPRPWELAADENRDAEVAVTIAAADPATAVVAISDPVSISFSPSALEAGLSYFSGERSGVLRALIGGGAQPLVLPTARFACVGCHAASRDGSTLGYVYDRRFLGAARAADPGRTLLAPAEPPQPDAATVSLNADGSLLAISQEGRLSVRESASGRELAAQQQFGGGLYFPEWSPDGKQIAATLSTSAENGYTVNDGSIVVLAWEGTDFGPMTMLVAGDATRMHYQPTWSPDGAWIAFASAPKPGSSYDNREAQLRLVPRAGGTPVTLTRATGGLGAGWPRFAPAAHAGGNVFYLGFDSRLDYGYLLRNREDPAGGHPQLWLAAVDLRRLPGGDPSSAPIWLPFQNLHVANVLPSWSERLACGADSPCGVRARCEDGHCVRVAP